MFEAIVRGSRIGTYEDFGTLVSMLWLHLGKSGMKILPNRITPQSSWASHYYRGTNSIVLPYQVRQFCLDRGVTQSGETREGVTAVTDEEIREFFRKNDRYNRALFGDKLMTDRVAVADTAKYAKPFELIIWEHRVAAGFSTFNEVIQRHDAEMNRIIAKSGVHTPFHTACFRHKVNGRYCFAFGGQVLHFCLAQGLKSVGRHGVSGEASKEEIDSFFLHYDDHNRRAFRWIVEAKEQILAHIP